MDKYIIIRADTKSISPPMSKQEAIQKLKKYDKDGICSYLIHKNIPIKDINHLNIYK